MSSARCRASFFRFDRDWAVFVGTTDRSSLPACALAKHLWRDCDSAATRL